MENENIVNGGDIITENYYIDIPSDVPVTIYTDNVSLVDTSFPSSDYQLSEYFVNYFQGYLANIPQTEYIAFALNSNHYFLVYDLEVENGVVVNGDYPCVQIYRDDLNGCYYNVTETTYSLTSYPSFCYGSVRGTSDLRKGGTHYETLSIIFCFAFLLLYIVLRDIFKHVPMFNRQSK